MLIANHEYTAPWWLPGGHTQTIYSALFGRTHPPSYTRERWSTPDGDFIDLDWVNHHAHESSAEPASPLLVLLHGLEGSSNSHYARALMAAVRTWGWLGVVPHFRSCSGEMNLAPRFYHSGDSSEIAWIVKSLHQQHPQRPLYVVGVSLGGNALLRFLGEQTKATSFIRAAAAISVPLDLEASGNTLSAPTNLVYTYKFLRTLKTKSLKKLQQYPGLFDRAAMLACRTLYAFDNVVTAPLHGYRNTQDYWRRASCLKILPDIAIPTLLLNALNDPFLPGKYLPKKNHVSRTVYLEQPKQGGHVGFCQGYFPGHLNWLVQRLDHFFKSIT
jgi:predicted alpha/beta-fold hydrolase